MPENQSSVDTIDGDSLSSLEDQLALLFSRLRVIWRDAAQELGLQPQSLKLLAIIERNSREDQPATTSATELANLLNTDRAAISRQTKALEQAGLIRRDSDGADARYRSCTITPLGRTVMSRGRQLTRDRLRTALAGADDGLQNRLLADLTLFNAAVVATLAQKYE